VISQQPWAAVRVGCFIFTWHATSGILNDQTPRHFLFILLLLVQRYKVVYMDTVVSSLTGGDLAAPNYSCVSPMMPFVLQIQFAERS